MIKCNLAVLLAERNLKISEVSKRTGISRTTLTALTQNQSKGIQFDTFDKLCTTLKISPNDLFIQERFEYDFSVSLTKVPNLLFLRVEFNIDSVIKLRNSEIEDQIKASWSIMKIEITEKDLENIKVELHYPESILSFIDSIPVSFFTAMESEIIDCIEKAIILEFDLEKDSIKNIELINNI